MPFSQAPNLVVALARITPSGGALIGTAVALGGRKFATAFHVTGADDSNLVIVVPRIGSMQDYQDTSDDKLATARARIVASDPLHDLCILDVDAQVQVGYTIGSTDDVPPGMPVVTFGFPHAETGRFVLTQQDTKVGARILVDSSGIKSKHIVLNTQARPGQSGGPVFTAAPPFKLIAVLVGSYAPGGGGGISLGGIDPHTLHQTTHAVSAEYLLGMLK